jgi:hypothetical protein
MANENELIQGIADKLGPEKLQSLVDQIEQQLSQDPDVTPELIEELIKQLRYVIENPDQYAEVVASAVQAGALDAEDIPPEFDPIFIGTMLLALQELQARGSEQGFKKGGLAKAAKQLAAQGRGGDTMLAHINPREAEVLRRMGGAGTVNPNTGLKEFKGKLFKGIGKILKAAAPFVATAIGGPWLGAAVGAGIGAADGGLKGALLGGLGAALMPGGLASGLTEGLGSTVLGALPSGLSSAISGVVNPSTIGAGLLGAGTSAIAGKNPLKGGLTAAAMSGLANSLQNSNLLPKTGALNTIANNAITGARTSSLVGGNPLVGAAGGAMGGAANIALDQLGNQFNTPNWLRPTMPEAAPVDAAMNTGIPEPGSLDAYSTQNLANAGATPVGPNYNIGASTGQTQGMTNPYGLPTPAPDFSTGQNQVTGNYGFTNPAAGGGNFIDTAMNAVGNASASDLLKYGGLGMTLLSAVSAQPNIPKMATVEGSTDNRKLMNMLGNMPAGLRQQLEQTNQLGSWLAQNWGSVPASYASEQAIPIGKARGGFLSHLALAKGGGTGRDDTIPARLSDGEYVIDAETVALLGNGSNDAGARALDMMRKNIRMQKGKALAKGKFSPNAKGPLAYLGGK